MCDTIGRIVSGELALFAKNSDRSPNEAQVIEFVEHKHHTEKDLRCTYITIGQVPETNAMVLSRPSWLWGAEMGVNEHGVCIGNEAVFTKGKYGEDSLIGMDYLRLALERGNTASQALGVITSLLEEYGQGGNCGYDKNFHYDNSYLIMDRREIYVLETCGKNWAYKQYDRASISNRLTLGTDADACSEGETDFRKKHSDLLFTTFSGSAKRRNATCVHRFDTVYDAFDALRGHSVKNPMCRASVSSVCMHAGSPVADQTTSSMVVELTDTIRIFVTGSSRPCLSVFKPYGFEAGGIIRREGDAGAETYWRKSERRQRKLLGRIIPGAYYAERDALERRLTGNAQHDLEEEAHFYAKWAERSFEKGMCAPGFARYWEKKNTAFSAFR